MTQDSQKQGSARISDDGIPQEAAGPRTLSEKRNRVHNRAHTAKLRVVNNFQTSF